MTTYSVEFRPRAKKRFDKLDSLSQRQIAKKLAERCLNPRVPGDALSRLPDCYKIKLRARGVRLVYQVQDQRLILLVLSIGAREREEAYDEAAAELRRLDE
ncbi:MAG: type II toxin-antitoxin system RelE/ParE family toxin [Novosphingobium sp.]